MKLIILTVFASALCCGAQTTVTNDDHLATADLPFIASTNALDLPLGATNAADTNKTSYELSLGGSGGFNSKNNKAQAEIDIGVSADPIKSMRNLWLGVDQSIGWQPNLQASTDIDAEWAFNVWKQTVYVEPGWSGGALYGSGAVGLRSGPELSVQYFMSDSVFVELDANYDALVSKPDGNGRLRYVFYIGWAF